MEWLSSVGNVFGVLKKCYVNIHHFVNGILTGIPMANWICYFKLWINCFKMPIQDRKWPTYNVQFMMIKINIYVYLYLKSESFNQFLYNQIPKLCLTTNIRLYGGRFNITPLLKRVRQILDSSYGDRFVYSIKYPLNFQC